MRRFLMLLSGIVGVYVGMNFALAMNTQYHYKLTSREVAEQVLPTIVQVGVAVPGNPQVETVGTGIVVRSDGYVLTAKHNVSPSAHVYIKTMDGAAYTVAYYVADAHRDLAVLKVVVERMEQVDPESEEQVLVKHELPAIELGGSDLAAGQEVMVFGFPAQHMINSLKATVSRGVISGVGRVIEEPTAKASEDDVADETNTAREFFLTPSQGLEMLFGKPKAYTKNMLQLDAMMNPGSSGGAVVDMEGRLIGVANSIISNTGSNAGLNFAIPIEEAIDVLSTIPPKKEVETNVGNSGSNEAR